MDWARVTLLLYILMRMSGFVLFNPIFGRRTMPKIVQAGMVMVLSVNVFLLDGTAGATPPTALIEFMLRMVLELAVGYAIGFVMQLFFYITVLAGNIIDTQMGMSMATTYDASSNASITVSSNLLNILMTLLFFAAGGHHTLMRIMLTSGEIVAYGGVSLGTDVSGAMVLLFVECTIMAVKLSLPVLAAEMIGEIGMGILMKAIPQINAFVINIGFKVIVGLLLMWLLMTPFSEFLLQAEGEMLGAMRRVIELMA